MANVFDLRVMTREGVFTFDKVSEILADGERMEAGFVLDEDLGHLKVVNDGVIHLFPSFDNLKLTEVKDDGDRDRK